MTRGVLFIVWGERIKPLLDRARASVMRHHPELPIHVERLPDGASLPDKARMFDWSPFDETLFLDADTIVLDRLDFGFAKAARHGLALSINECPVARRYLDKRLAGDTIEYNAGVMFFTASAAPVFEAWQALAPSVDGRVLLRSPATGKPALTVPQAQGSLALAMEHTGFNPFVLSPNWNFRPQFYGSIFGPAKIWHANNDPPAEFLRINQAMIDGKEPIVRMKVPA